jgi:hypothetical protein
LNPAKKIPIQRFGTKDDIANATVFLFSDAASYVSCCPLEEIFDTQRQKYIDACYPVSLIVEDHWHAIRYRWRRGASGLLFQACRYEQKLTICLCTTGPDEDAEYFHSIPRSSH